MRYLVNLFPANSRLPYDDFGWEIKSMGTSAQISRFCWIVRTTLSARDICSKLKYCIEDVDSILVSSFESWDHINLSGEVIRELNH